MDYTSQFDYGTVQRECELLGYRYLKVDHTWDCVNSTAVGSTFQYTFLNETYCAGISCLGSVPDYSYLFQGIGFSCNLTEFAASPASSALNVALGLTSFILPVIVAFLY